MSSPIKFRAWHPPTPANNEGVMRQVRKLEWIGGGLVATLEKNLVTNIFTLMQYTGLKDGSGGEIYEGDVLRYIDESEYFDYVVAYVERAAGFGLVDPRNQESYVSNMPVDSLDEYEVIGNIHENPELLKGGN